MTDRERIVGHRPLGEDLPVALAGRLGFGEVVGEIGADQRIAGSARGPRGGLVQVGDLAFWTNGDQRIQARLDQAPRVLSGHAYLVVRLDSIRDVALDR